MADQKLIYFPLPMGDKQIPGYLLVTEGQKNANAYWISKTETITNPNGEVVTPPFGDYSTFHSIKQPDGTYAPWSQTTSSSITNLANKTGLSTQQINTALYRNTTVQTKLNQARVAVLNGPNNAAKIDPKIPGVTNVAPADPPTKPGDEPAAAPISEAQLKDAVKYGSRRTKYSMDLKYPINIQPNQDCIRFEMLEYMPSTFNINSESKLGTGGSSIFVNNNQANTNIIGRVYLPIQSPISDSNTVIWGQDEMNSLTAEASAGALGLIAGGKDGKPISEIIKTLQEASPALKALVASDLANKAATGQSGNLFTRLTGGILNPNMELLFNGPQLRSFTFSFVMSAREPKEAEAIRSIIRFFKQGMSVKKAESSLFLMTPNVFKISYLYRGNNTDTIHPWMNRIKTCALRDCTVNYTPAGNYATYNDGSMTSYEISLSFGELTPIYDDDYSDTASGGDGNNDTQIGY